MLSDLIHDYTRDAALRRRFESDPQSVLEEYDIPEDVRERLRRRDPKVLAAHGYPDDAPAPGPWAGCSPVYVSSSDPQVGPVEKEIEFTVVGQCFAQNAELSFQRPHEVVEAKALGEVSFEFTATGLFSVLRASAKFSEPGSYNVIVTNPDGEEGPLPQGFTATSE